MIVVLRRAATMAAIVIALATSATAWSQAPAVPGSAPITGFQLVTTSSGSARITAIDPATRTVALAFSDGQAGSYRVGDAVQNLAQFKVGDSIDVFYEEWLSFVLSGPNAPTPADRSITGSMVTGPGRAPAGAAANQTVVNWVVVRTDVPGNTIALVNPAGGQVRSFAVKSVAGRAELPRVKPGDKLTAISTELIVMAVVPKR